MTIFAPSKSRLLIHTNIRRDGRVVDYNGLENRRTERYRGFESLSLRNKGCKILQKNVNYKAIGISMDWQNEPL